MIKYEFASPEWFRAVHSLVVQAVESAGDLSGSDWSVCETFTNMPSHLQQGSDSTTAWHYFLRDGEISFGFGANEDVKFSATIDWAVGQELATLYIGGDEKVQADMEAKVLEAITSGRASIVGSRDDRPENLPNFHDALALITR